MWTVSYNELRFSTIEGLSELIKKTDYYKNSREKNLVLDKASWVVSQILEFNLKTNLGYYNYVNISSIKLKQILGNNYLDVIKCLVELDLIIINQKYSTNRFSKSFRLTSKLLELGKIIPAEIKSKRFFSRIEELHKRETEKMLNNPLYLKIINNTLNLSFIDDYIHYIPLPETIEVKEINGHIVSDYEDNTYQLNRYSEFGKVLKQLDGETEVEKISKMSLYFSPNISSYGRLYHFICSVPSRMRELMRTKNNELLYEVDMSSAQLTILILEWIKSGQHNSAKSKEIELILQLLIDGNIYHFIQSESKYFEKMSYKKLKESILKIINAEYNPGKGNKELKRLFPGFMHWINRLKKDNGHQFVSHIHQKAESNIFIKVFEELPDKIFALPIHDCIISNKENIKGIQQKVIQRFIKLYGKFIPSQNSFDEVFRIKRVSLEDKELSLNQIKKLKESDLKPIDF